MLIYKSFGVVLSEIQKDLYSYSQLETKIAHGGHIFRQIHVRNEN